MERTNAALLYYSLFSFISYLLSKKETAETEYWLRLLQMSEYLSESEGQALLADCLEIKKLLIASINTAKAKTK